MKPIILEILKMNSEPYIFFLSGRSTYLVFMSSMSDMRWWKDSRSITRQVTPSGSSATMFAVRFSSLNTLIDTLMDD